MEFSSGLSERTIESIVNVFKKYPEITQVLLYGSRAMGNFKNGSDIDLTLKGNGLTIEILLKIDNALDDLLLPYKIDLSLYDNITNEAIYDHINRFGTVFWEPSTHFEIIR
jgi:predicted nucleotidyltransferase